MHPAIEAYNRARQLEEDRRALALAALRQGLTLSEILQLRARLYFAVWMIQTGRITEDA